MSWPSSQRVPKAVRRYAKYRFRWNPRRAPVTSGSVTTGTPKRYSLLLVVARELSTSKARVCYRMTAGTDGNSEGGAAHWGCFNAVATEHTVQQRRTAGKGYTNARITNSRAFSTRNPTSCTKKWTHSSLTVDTRTPHTHTTNHEHSRPQSTNCVAKIDRYEGAGTRQGVLRSRRRSCVLTLHAQIGSNAPKNNPRIRRRRWRRRSRRRLRRRRRRHRRRRRRRRCAMTTLGKGRGASLPHQNR